MNHNLRDKATVHDSGSNTSISYIELGKIIDDVYNRKLGWLDIKMLLFHPKQTIIFSAVGVEFLYLMGKKVRK